MPLVALIALLVVAYVHPRGRTEALVGIVAAGAALATGTLHWAGVRAELKHLLPVVIFLAAILVVAECCRAEGLFAAVGQRLAQVRWPLALTFAVAALTTIALSLDATVVLLTPVVVAAAAAARWSGRAGQLACVRLANSGSLLLPVSNLTNLLALPFLAISFGRFAVLMAPAWLVVVLIEYVVIRVWCRDRNVDPESGLDKLDHRGELDPLPLVPLAVVVLMLAAFAATSPLGVNPAWVAVVAAVALGVHGLVRRTETPVELVQSAHLSFGLFVLCLGLVVAVLSRAWLGDLVGHLVPSNDGLVALLLLAALGAVLANAVNNLPATLLLVPLVAPLGTTAVLATLIGINVGSSLTWTGSLANLLWRRTLVRAGVRPSSRDFHLVALIASPLGILAGVCVLAGWSALIT